jgi:hydrogenase expression/formation protein HypC
MCLAVPGSILEITAEDPIFRMGRVSFGGVIRDVNLAYTPEARVGDYVLVHAGFAIGTVDEQEAARALQYLREMNDLADLE